MQVDPVDSNSSTAALDQLWHWKQNIASGKLRLSSKLNDDPLNSATAFWSRQRTQEYNYNSTHAHKIVSIGFRAYCCELCIHSRALWDQPFSRPGNKFDRHSDAFLSGWNLVETVQRGKPRKLCLAHYSGELRAVLAIQFNERPRLRLRSTSLYGKSIDVNNQ